jgi:hypothetical protein
MGTNKIITPKKYAKFSIIKNQKLKTQNCLIILLSPLPAGPFNIAHTNLADEM